MQKVYLLLRSNKQTGPHTLDELLALTLKPTDLIWVEGKSAGWSHPSEIDTLRSFITPSPTPEPIVPMQPGHRSNPTPSASPAKVFVSLPFGKTPQSVPSLSDPIEEKAAALRQKILSGEAPSAQQEVQTKYARTLEEVENEYTSWMYRKKTVRKKPISKGAVVLVGAVALTGVALAWWLNQPGEAPGATKASAATSLLQTPETQAPSSAPPNEPAEETTHKDPAPVVNRTIAAVSRTAGPPRQKAEKKAVPTKTIDPESTAGRPAASEPEREPASTAPVSQDPAPEEIPAEKPEEKKKKKTIKEFLSGIFRKKDREETPSTAPASNGERPTARRESGETEAAVVDLSDKVTLKIDKPSTDWMMGVEGQKLILTNKSAHNLQSATIEVSYYSEQKSLLQKKILLYGPVASGKSQTLAIPNHRMADHVSYEIREARGN